MCTCKNQLFMTIGMIIISPALIYTLPLLDIQMSFFDSIKHFVFTRSCVDISVVDLAPVDGPIAELVRKVFIAATNWHLAFSLLHFMLDI